MARKLSRVGRWILVMVATATVLPAAMPRFAFAQRIQVQPTTTDVVNPFAAKRAASVAGDPASTSPARPATPIAESGGPTTVNNPFAGGAKSPRFVTPRLQPGPLSRWHRSQQSPPPQVDQRPIQAVAIEDGLVRARGDLSGPLAQEERRTALFAIPGGEEPLDLANPPDPTRFARKELEQPTWLLPHEMQVAKANEEASQKFAVERATAQKAIDPFEETRAAEVYVTDEAPATQAVLTGPVEATADGPHLLPQQAPQQSQHQQRPQQIEVSGPELKLPTAALSVVHPLRPQLAAAAPVAAKSDAAAPTIAQAPQPKERTADDWYADAEQAAGNAVTTGELAAVVQLCQRGIDCRPDPELAKSLRSLAAWACNRSGEIESDQHRDDVALKAFELAIQWDPSCWLALHNRAVSRAQQGDLDGALADFNRTLELNPGLAVAFRNRGELLAATGKTEEAISDYTVALAQLPQDAELLTMRGESFHRLGEYEQALADLSQAIEIDSRFAAALSQRGNVQAELGKFALAVADFQRAIAADPNWAEAHRSFAWLMATCPDPRFRNPRQALAAAKTAARLAAPGDPFVLDALAAAQANVGNFAAAARIQRDALANVPPDFAAPFQERFALYSSQQPFRNGSTELIDENVRAASLETESRVNR